MLESEQRLGNQVREREDEGGFFRVDDGGECRHRVGVVDAAVGDPQLGGVRFHGLHFRCQGCVGKPHLNVCGGDAGDFVWLRHAPPSSGGGGNHGNAFVESLPVGHGPQDGGDQVALFYCPVGDFVGFDVVGVPVSAVRPVGDDQVWRVGEEDVFELFYGFVAGVHEGPGVLVCRVAGHARVAPAAGTA